MQSCNVDDMTEFIIDSTYNSTSFEFSYSYVVDLTTLTIYLEILIQNCEQSVLLLKKSGQ